MKRNICIGILVMVFGLTFLTGKALAEKKIPMPMQFKLLSADMEQVEDAIREEKYDDASREIKEVEGNYAEMLPVLKEVASKELLDSYTFALTQWKEGIIAKESAEILESKERTMRSLFLEIADQFYSLYPPIIDYIMEEFDECQEEGEKKEWDDAEEAIEEAETQLPNLEAKIKKAGISTKYLEELKGPMAEMKDAVKKKDEEKLGDARVKATTVLNNMCCEFVK